MELGEYRDVLEFYPEYQLTSEPLRIDCVIIKKAKDVMIKKSIAAIFREWNLLEYKSPGDYVSIADFYKVYGYACLYAYLENVPVTGMTITLIQSGNPEGLLDHFKKGRNFAVEETVSGIYTVSSDILPIQVIDNSRLSAEENIWLKNLSNRLDVRSFSRISRELRSLGKDARIAAYYDVITRANTRIVREALQMSDEDELTLEEVLEEAGLIAKWEARAEARGVTQEKEQTVHSMLQLGLPLETIAAATRLNIEKVKDLMANTPA